MKHLKQLKHLCLQSFVVIFKQMFEAFAAFEAFMFAVSCSDLHAIYINLQQFEDKEFVALEALEALEALGAMFSGSGLKMFVKAAAVASIAVVAGMQIDQMQALQFLQAFKVELGAGAAVAVAVVVIVKLLKHMQCMEEMVQTLVEKCSYMEQRMDKAQGKVSDVCRHLSRTFADFDPAANYAVTLKEKWWWVCRRVRDCYEDFSGALMEKGLTFEGCTGAWSLLCLEVYLRCCRDVAALRFAADCGEEVDPEELYSGENALQNFEAVQNFPDICSFWSPLNMQMLEGFQPSSGVEMVLKGQAMERVAELMQYASHEKAADFFKGMKLQGAGIALAGSSDM